jgi:hypothetical protein
VIKHVTHNVIFKSELLDVDLKLESTQEQNSEGGPLLAKRG